MQMSCACPHAQPSWLPGLPASASPALLRTLPPALWPPCSSSRTPASGPLHDAYSCRVLFPWQPRGPASGSVSGLLLWLHQTRPPWPPCWLPHACLLCPFSTFSNPEGPDSVLQAPEPSGFWLGSAVGSTQASVGGGRRGIAGLCDPGLAPLSAPAMSVAAAPLVRPSSVATALSRLWKHDSFSHLLELKDANAWCCPNWMPPPSFLGFLNASCGSVSNSFTGSLDFHPLRLPSLTCWGPDWYSIYLK